MFAVLNPAWNLTHIAVVGSMVWIAGIQSNLNPSKKTIPVRDYYFKNNPHIYSRQPSCLNLYFNSIHTPPPLIFFVHSCRAFEDTHSLAPNDKREEDRLTIGSLYVRVYVEV